ncbi:hypothetical protein OG393_03325 [Streptomyces sp. NBC_01216]|uniref:hypothetical protein n=1 Tax=Streptomyces sp. NBC_01216 TaxID=2903778 RepID=UPI002E13BE46|nr:hypothetical protein OG393_03325 [Streptomyces sp. NBC_01216]
MFISLNGPDNVGKTTHLRRLATRFSNIQLLGSVHEHNAAAWERVAGEDYAAWWFERSTTAELTGLLLDSYDKRSAALEPGRFGLLDRGMPMLIAVSAATASVKEASSPAEALGAVERIAASRTPTREMSVLLLPSLDADRSYEITSAREGRPWTGVYPTYQRALHGVLLHQVERGAYAGVVDCEGKSIEQVQAEVMSIAGPVLSPSTYAEDSR